MVSMDETGVEWQQQLGNWWQSDKPWLRQALQLESEKQRDWVLLALKTRRRRGGQNERRGRVKRSLSGRRPSAGR